LLAADRLVESLQGLPQEDALLYPILYLYQHHIELELKGSISLFLNWLHRGTAEEREKVFDYLGREHSINNLWNKLKEVAPTVVNQLGQATTKAFESLLQQVSEPGSNEPGSKHRPFDQAVRYARYKDGSQTLLGVNEVDLDNLKTQFHKMSHYLGAIAEGIHQEIDPE